MNSLKAFLYLCTIAGIIMTTSCSDDDPIIENEEELITTVIYRLEPLNGGDVVEFRFTDLDGDGGDEPVIIANPLQANTEYSGTMSFLDESSGTAESITEEIEEEALEHQVFYVVSGNSVAIEYNDADSDSNPIGLNTNLSTSEAETGSLRVILRHEPDKAAQGVADGDPSNAGGETDIEVLFLYTVE